jgi:hypothetical protein
MLATLRYSACMHVCVWWALWETERQASRPTEPATEPATKESGTNILSSRNTVVLLLLREEI